MGQLADDMVGRSEAVAGYYLAALHYIDPALSAGSSMDDVIGAAARKQRYLRSHPGATTAIELSQLAEALLFVQRVRRTAASCD
jgi:hypothetical protein